MLDRAKTAAGGAAWDAVAVIRGSGELEAAGFRGSLVRAENLHGGGFRSDIDLGPLKRSEGYDGETFWYRDGAGEVTAEQGAGLVAGARNEAWLAARAYWYPQRWPARIEYLREEVQREPAAGEKRLHVLGIEPAGGRAFELWLDAATLALARIVDDDGRFVETTELSDYQLIDGLRLPLRQVTTTHEAGRLVRRAQILWRELAVERRPDATIGAVPGGGARDYRLPAGQDSVQLPFELANNHIYIDVRVNGRPMRFLVDTGGFNLLTREAVEALGLQAAGSIPAGGTGESRTEVGVVEIGELELGGLQLDDQLFYVIDLSSIHGAEGLAFDGLVGFEVFKRFVVRIDYDDARLSLTLPEAFRYTGDGQRIPIRLNEGTPEVDGTIDGIPGVFSIDTGSRSVLDIHTPFARSHDFAARYCPCVEGLTGWGLGGPVRSKVARADQLILGEVAVGDVLLEISMQEAGSYTDQYIAGNIGGGLLKRFDVVFDYSRSLMILERNRLYDRPEGYDRSGLWLNRSDAAFVVVDVIAGSPADRAGLAVGDRIMRIDDRPVAELRLSDVRERLRTAAAVTEVRIRVRRDDAEREVALVLQQLVR